MKNSWDWTESDILELIKNGVPESLNLDYKRSESLANTDGKKNELSKDVSAFANSAGGMLIYGVIEDGRFPTSIDDGVDPNVISKEWIEQVISSRIQRRISGIRINQIQLSPPSTNVIYVLDIPQSHLAPHMASDNRFYKRFNFKSVPMEEYEVRDVGNRNLTPDLSFKIKLDSNILTFVPNANYCEPIVCRFLMFNNSVVPAEYSAIQLFVDSRLQLSNIGSFMENGDTTITVGDETVKTKKYHQNLSPQTSMPILHGVDFEVTNGSSQIRFPKDNGIYFIYVNLLTSGVEPRQFLFAFLHDGEKVDVVSEKQLTRILDKLQ